MDYILQDMNYIPDISGLHYVPDAITIDKEEELLAIIDDQDWNTSLSRRTQHYGVEYNYKTKKIDKSNIEPLPDWMLDITELLAFDPQQCIINEYTGKQGIAAHTDSKLFGPIIASLSLGSPVSMEFSKAGVIEYLLLEPRSLIFMEDEARYDWKHSISPTASYIINIDGKLPRVNRENNFRRVSLTFRTIA